MEKLFDLMLKHSKTVRRLVIEFFYEKKLFGLGYAKLRNVHTQSQVNKFNCLNAVQYLELIFIFLCHKNCVKRIRYDGCDGAKTKTHIKF